MDDNENKENSNNQQILSINFNQDSSCFAIGTQTGFRIYNSSPFKENIERSKKINNFQKSKEE